MLTVDPNPLAPQHPFTYLGDAVYARFDGYQIWLHANDAETPTDRIAIEPAVFVALVDYATQYYGGHVQSLSEADLSLRDAAPALLEAAQAALKAMDRWADLLGDTPPFDRTNLSTRELLRNAISKARP